MKKIYVEVPEHESVSEANSKAGSHHRLPGTSRAITRDAAAGPGGWPPGGLWWLCSLLWKTLKWGVLSEEFFQNSQTPKSKAINSQGSDTPNLSNPGLQGRLYSQGTGSSGFS